MSGVGVGRRPPRMDRRGRSRYRVGDRGAGPRGRTRRDSRHADEAAEV